MKRSALGVCWQVSVLATALMLTAGAVAGAPETEDELANAAAAADLHGLFNDPHTGVALACTQKLVNAGTIKETESVVVISTAHGLKFSEFKTGYHDGTLADVSARYGNQPVRLPANVEKVRTAIESRIQ